LYSAPGVIKVIKKCIKGMICSTQWREGEVDTEYFFSENLQGRDDLGDLAVDGRIISELVYGVDLSRLARHMAQSRENVNTLIYLCVL
jgi:hypothetical protein